LCLSEGADSVGEVPRPSGADPNLARALRSLREERGLSQEALAHAAQMTMSSYARIERGQANPTWLTVTHIADALGVTLRELVDVIEDQRPT
jgi:transcriptional regulator with XRE-family HTH domain